MLELDKAGLLPTSQEMYPVALAIVALVAIPAAWLSYWVIEYPASLLGKLRTAPASPGLLPGAGTGPYLTGSRREQARPGALPEAHRAGLPIATGERDPTPSRWRSGRSSVRPGTRAPAPRQDRPPPTRRRP
ncbi:hypothetical protein NKH77_33065 [Streptomyces sp. M19]